MTDNIDYENNDFKAFVKFMARMIEKYGPLEEDTIAFFMLVVQEALMLSLQG